MLSNVGVGYSRILTKYTILSFLTKMISLNFLRLSFFGLFIGVIAQTYLMTVSNRITPRTTTHACRDGEDNFIVALHTHIAESEQGTTNQNEVVLVSHMTLDRLPQALRWCRAWRGPMSLALFIRPQDNRDDVMDTVLRHGDDRCLQRHADIHLVERTVGGGDANKTDMMTHYPFNVQRNAALDGVRHGTRWVFLVDVDMVLMPRNESSHAMFSAHLARVRAATPHAQMPQHSVLIVPSVETVVPEVPLPTTMEE
eukprot:PhM_4_TR5245/c0_g1_i2/m.54285